MVSTPVHNISDFIKNRPPLVLFLICLVILAVSTFYFAFEIEKDNPIIDSDKKHDWISMIKHFNKIDMCVGLSKWKDELDQKHQDTLNDITVYTPVEIKKMDLLEPFTKVHGLLTLQEWYPVSCQDTNDPPANISISFIVPKEKSANNSQRICVAIKGSAFYLPYFKDPLCKSVGKPQKTTGTVGFLTSKLRKESESEFCLNGISINMLFDLQQKDVANYLSDDIRTQIYIHLMWCSYFLVLVIFVILIIAIVKKSEYLEKKEQAARLL